METKTCNMCKIKKLFNNFWKIYKEYKVCNNERSPKRYYENKDETSNQRKKYYEKNRDKILQKQNNRYLYFEELLKSYVELENRIKALKENFSRNDSENKKKFYRWNLFQTTTTDFYHQQNRCLLYW